MVLIVSLTPLQAAQANHTDRLEQTRREINAAKARLRTVQQSEAQVRSQLASITSQLRSQQASLAAARARLAQIDLKIRAQERELRTLRAEETAKQEAISARARALYMMGPADTFQALTSAKTIEEFVGRAGAIEMVTAADRVTIEQLQSAAFQVRRVRMALRERRAEAVDVRDEVAKRVAIVADMAAVQREAQNKLAGQINKYKNEIAALEREQARILALIRQRQSTSTGPISRSGFIWPIRGQITSPYGPRWGRFHTGMDINCNTGNPIRASKAGRVIESGWGGGYGNMIIIDHGNGVATLYAHMSRLYSGRGASVSQGHVIGACGSTGNSTGAHLHFEVRINGRHTNPRPYLP